MGAAWGCAGVQLGAVRARTTGLRVGARRGCAGGSVELRCGETAAEGAPRGAAQVCSMRFWWDCAGAKYGAAEARSMQLRRGTAWECDAAQLAAAQWALRGVAQGRSPRLRWSAAWGCAGGQRGTAHGRRMRLRMGTAWGRAGGSVGLRWGAAAAGGEQHVAEQRVQNGAVLGPSMRPRWSAMGRGLGPC